VVLRKGGDLALEEERLWRKVYSGAKSVNEEDPERDHATQV
jgi:hypothetical protein